jgi:hypothetical protein
MKHETILLGTMLALLGCVGPGIESSNQERQKLYQDHSTPVESFRITKLQGRQTRWSPIGDQALLVYDEADQPHLLELKEKCSGLATARSISITNSAGTVTPGSDSVQLIGPTKAGSAYFCRIATARRVDMSAVKETREEMREASPVEP